MWSIPTITYNESFYITIILQNSYARVIVVYPASYDYNLQCLEQSRNQRLCISCIPSNHNQLSKLFSSNIQIYG